MAVDSESIFGKLDNYGPPIPSDVDERVNYLGPGRYWGLDMLYLPRCEEHQTS